ncbi:hypothetical protein BSY44_23065 [Salmonella enterica subsp. enterica serovar Paratyphi B]|nr:hypothetical protein [Salmonella enterica]ECO1613276.1 hypothetical protein [Salmonella enterica subsp. enterica serovar Paratyphi B]EGZ3914732.1 hypothetical protein [Salmonella enterica subsp. enterica serovar Java]EDD4443649.1 hypothetical protein [Salmonella enterica subsp. enterica serovar Paratyphi B]MDJ7766701.1 hypothetical protein [Salmonella enterica]
MTLISFYSFYSFVSVWGECGSHGGLIFGLISGESYGMGELGGYILQAIFTKQFYRVNNTSAGLSVK